MSNPLAEAVYDHDDIQGQAFSRQEQDHMNQVQPGEKCDCYLHKTATPTTELRERLRTIVTRDGLSVRIPEILELELDKLVALFEEELLKARLSEVEDFKQWHSVHSFSETDEALRETKKIETYCSDRLKALQTKKDHAEKLDKKCLKCGSVFRRLTEHLKIAHGYYYRDDRLVAP